MPEQLPAEPGDCRRFAEQSLDEAAPVHAAVWALLAVAGELAEIRRELRRGR